MVTRPFPDLFFWGKRKISAYILVRVYGEVSPCPPGYMHLKALPSSSAWTLPAGVSSPPHFSTSSREGSSLCTSAHTHTQTNYLESLDSYRVIQETNTEFRAS